MAEFKVGVPKTMTPSEVEALKAAGITPDPVAPAVFAGFHESGQVLCYFRVSAEDKGEARLRVAEVLNVDAENLIVRPA